MAANMATKIESTMEPKIEPGMATIKVNINADYEGVLCKFVYVVDRNGHFWFAGKALVEMLQNSSLNTDRVINKLDECYRKKLQQIINEFNTCEKLPKYVQEKSIMINVEGVKIMIENNAAATESKKKWINEKIDIIVNNGNFEDSVDIVQKNLPEQQVSIFNDIIEEIIPNNLQLKEMEFNGEKFNFVVIYDDQHELWMLGKPIAEYLEYLAPRNILLQLNSSYIRKYDEFKHDIRFALNPCKQYINAQNITIASIFINQAGLFELINKSTMPKAKEFQNWVNGDVLPKLAKNKVYFMSEAPIEQKKQMESIKQFASKSDDIVKMEIELQSTRDALQKTNKRLFEMAEEANTTKQQLKTIVQIINKKDEQLASANNQLLSANNQILKYVDIADTANKNSIEIYKQSNIKLGCVYERLLSTTQLAHKALQVLADNAAERPKDANSYQVLEVYEVSMDDLPENYTHLFGYTCSRIQKKNAGKKFKMSHYDRIYISESPNATIAWQCVKDRLNTIKEGIIEYNKNITNPEDLQDVIECIYRGNYIYCSLDKFEMVKILKQRSFGVDIEELNNMIEPVDESIISIGSLPSIEMSMIET